ncbi:M43 family zinc metalloprotease [Cyclobacterium marinum]|uniref:Peptidase M43B pregnancy-associated plasma-A n=1 Tax=Cyclobacterium marinum (strain ATCC 25205 / DSM 745 / LMG 13164 / NCIMB 1802) TaxID=880070 RepID=G0IXJ7_CYCMS|nr:M43 family zinc metalloprotease [Cyclobacterium marinum]AEL27186.1 hypothetical protein Cycma_3466 [Cyclobacterium marinum DSM 745]
MIKYSNALIFCLVSVQFFFIGAGNFALGQNEASTDSEGRTLEQCATVFFEEKQAQSLGYFGSKAYFEGWVEAKGEQLRLESEGNRTLADEIRQLPVVIHVIHHGEAIGEGANISDAQILDQIRILNEDFKMQNADFTTNTPTEFLDVASSAGIEFVLAKQDPQGMPSNGINRVEGPKDTYGLNDAALVGQLASWAPEEYLNIWVMPLTPPTIGFASFPISNELEGLSNPTVTRETDGVAIDYNYFGSIGNVSQNSRGRTATHEMGHFLGLRHIWGDGGCEVDDYVTDTPLQSQSNNTCVATPRFTCDSRDMVENFMDYTPDRCMSLFTEGQVERMDVILTYSPRRASLLSSRALSDPQIYSYDLELTEIVSPSNYRCSNTIVPVIEVVNAGQETVTSVRASIQVNGTDQETKDFEVNIELGEAALLEFSEIFLSGSTNTFGAEIVLVNGAEDEDQSNNFQSITTNLPATAALPYSYPGHNVNSGWEYINEDQSYTWTPIDLQVDGSATEVFLLNGFDYNGQGELDYLVSPVFDLSDLQNPQLSFDLAYSPFSNSAYSESLIVAVSTDCGNTFNLLTAPYHKSGSTLGTVDVSSNEFVPNAEEQFRKELVNLSSFAGESDVRIAFVSINGYGNNIFIKNINITADEDLKYLVGINAVEEPLPVVNGEQVADKLTLTNNGNLPVTSFYLNKGSGESTLIEDVSIAPGSSISVELDNSFDPGLNQVTYEVSMPNFDQNDDSGDQLTRYFIQDEASILAPWRQNFDSGQLDDWLSINPENNLPSWQVASLSSENQAVLSEMEKDNSYWLVSPEFSLDGTSRAGLIFDYGGNGFSADGLSGFSILVSIDGGQTGQTVWEVTGEALNKQMVSNGSDDESQHSFVNLNDFAGEEKVRIYFKVQNENDTDGVLQLDNISLYLSDNPDPVVPEINQTLIYPNPAQDVFNITFNLQDYEEVTIQFFSTSGQKAYDVTFSNTLNQTYTFGKEHLSSGLFIVKIIGEDFLLTKRLVIQ